MEKDPIFAEAERLYMLENPGGCLAAEDETVKRYWMGKTNGVALAVVGSRTFADSRKLSAVLTALQPSIVISGGARGADRMAESWARKNDIPTKIFLPDHKRYRHPYHHRNRLIAEACDRLLAFWDGRSSGTRYTIDYAKRIGKPVEIVRF